VGLGVAVLLLVAPVAAGAQAGPEARLTVRDAVAASLEANRQLANARWQLEAAQDQAREAWGSIMPKLNFNASYTRNLEVPTQFLPAVIFDPTAGPEDVIGVQFGSDNQWFAQARADQPLFNAAAFLGVSAAGRFEALQQEALRGQAQQVATQARLRYYDVLLAEEQLRLTRQSRDRVARVLAETRQLNEAGLASDYEVLRFDVELSNLEPNVARTENAVASARRALAIAMGREALGDLELAGSLLAVELPEDGGVESDAALLLDRPIRAEALPTEEVLRVAMERRSDIQQLVLTKDLRSTERTVEITRYLPQISIFGTWTASGQGNGSPTFFGDQNASSSAVGLEVSVPLFSGFQRPARVSRLGAVVEQVTAQLELVRDQALNEVRTLRDRAQEARERALAQRRAVEQARRGYEIARSQYEAGTGSQLQVTDSELALRQSEFNYAQAVYDYLTTQARLDAAVGVVPMVDAGDAVALQR
jgi:outer membrane protein TolC